MTLAEFIAFYPQFTDFTPSIVPETYVVQANDRFSEFGEDTEEARRLYVAHKLTLYAQTALPAGSAASLADLASAGEKRQQISSKKVGEVSVTYSSSSSSSSSSDTASSTLADLSETTYGLQLLSLIRLHRMPMYVP